MRTDIVSCISRKAFDEHASAMEKLDVKVLDSFRSDVLKIADSCVATQVEASLVKAFDTITDKALLYDAVLACDRKLKKMKVTTSAVVLHSAIHKRMESILS